MEDQFKHWEIENYTRISAYDGRGDKDLGDILKGRYPDNMSSGRVTGTNSPYIKRALGDHVVFGGTPITLYENLLNAEQNKSINIRDAMIFVKENHTYINRVGNILKFL